MSHMSHVTHVTIVLKTASTLTSFDIRSSRNNCCLSSAIMGVVGATSSFPDTDFLVYLVCTSTLSSLKWKRHRSVLVKHDLLEIKSVHCLTLTAAPNWGSMPGTRSSLCFFPFQIPGILAHFLAGSSSIETVGQCRWLGFEAMFGSQASENHASLIHETQLSSARGQSHATLIVGKSREWEV